VGTEQRVDFGVDGVARRVTKRRLGVEKVLSQYGVLVIWLNRNGCVGEE
jgi:hypothetical protein